MNESFKRIVETIQKQQGVNLTPARAKSIEDQRTQLLMRVQTLERTCFRTRSDFVATHNALVSEMNALRRYAEFQVQQQKEAQRAPLGPLTVTKEETPRHTLLRVPVEGESTLEFTYMPTDRRIGWYTNVQEVPYTVSGIGPTNVYTMQRVTRNGQQFLEFRVVPTFSGTFTFGVNGRRATVNVAAFSGTPVAEPAFTGPQPREVPQEQQTKTRETQVAEFKRLVAQAIKLSGEIKLAIANNQPVSEETQKQMKELNARIDELEQQINKAETQPVSAPPATNGSPSSQGPETAPAPPRVPENILDPRIRGIYGYLLTQPRDQWITAGVPGGVPGAQYKLTADGKLFGQNLTRREDPWVKQYIADINPPHWVTLLPAQLQEIADTRIRGIYTHLFSQPRNQWYPGISIPGGIRESEYCLGMDGYLFCHRYGDPMYRIYRGNNWVPFAPAGR